MYLIWRSNTVLQPNSPHKTDIFIYFLVLKNPQKKIIIKIHMLGSVAEGNITTTKLPIKLAQNFKHRHFLEWCWCFYLFPKFMATFVTRHSKRYWMNVSQPGLIWDRPIEQNNLQNKQNIIRNKRHFPSYFQYLISASWTLFW